MNSKNSRILFMVTGSIACFKACQAISILKKKNFDIRVVATASALKFVGEASLEGLSGQAVASEVFQSGKMMDHIHLARWADVVVVAPATANFINSAAYGLADNLPLNIFLAHDFKKPFLIFPSMNSQMLVHPATQEAIAKLRKMKIQIMGTEIGELACGEYGEGRLLDPMQIADEIERAASLSANGISPFKILVTAGGTQEKIDDVRVIANTSTGQTGVTIATNLWKAGHDVTLLKAANTRVETPSGLPALSFKTFLELQQQLKDLLSTQTFTHVIHAAAVSDYSVLEIEDRLGTSLLQSKISSQLSELNIRLKANPKIIQHLKQYSKNPNLKVIGFKLTSQATELEIDTKVKEIFQFSDWVVHNDLNTLSEKRSDHVFNLFGPGKRETILGVNALSEKLMEVAL